MKIKLNEWVLNNRPDDNLIYKEGLYDQCSFVDGNIKNLLLNIATDYFNIEDFDEKSTIWNNFNPYAISTHMSKSVLLPVMEFDMSNIGIKIILRYNFYDWCISVESDSDIKYDFLRLTDNRDGFFEGFPNDRIYEKYSEENKRNFSLTLQNKYEVFTFVYLLRDWYLKKGKES